MIARWLSIKLKKTPYGWVWGDFAGWGDGTYRHFLSALRAALKG